MIQDAIHSMEIYTVQFPKTLLAIKLSELEYKASADKWSKKEILGHLIDSATNNLGRFIVAQYEDNPIIQYDQVAWCKGNYYQSSDINYMLVLWKGLNQQLIHVWKNLPIEALSRTANGQTLTFLATDYVAHFEHHFEQIKTR
ncbi:DinB family protein [Sphingobacterium deserti]|uniref:DinB-like domain-containing protein n=1 Tax=Sphingobacterium deserti TaxID=1229276 RepID=A0A0B8T6S3_9SPHI|nr:DinB family protein [Sphingobacterium deserti]KGE13105.1 hypothetical protein DI53_3129 [Sphingobacterium deserti]